MLMQLSKVRLTLFFFLLILVTLVFGYLLQPFFYPIFWAAVIASIFYPLYEKLYTKIKMKGLSSIIMLFLVFLIIFLPLTMISSLLIKESIDVYSSIDSNKSEIAQNMQGVFDWAKDNALLQRINFDESFWIEKISESAKTLTAFIFTNIKNFTQNSVIFIIMFVLMLYSLYYFFKDGKKFLETAMHLIPLGNKYEKILYNKFTGAATSALKGTLIIGGIQGLLGGLMFAFLGIQGAAIWGMIMVLLSILPIGSGLIWMPASIILLINGQTWQGITLLLFGILIISVIDNFLRPVLIGKQTKLHPLLILFSTLGGLAIFGFTGFVIGPILAALLVSMWDIYDEHYKDELLKY